MTDNHTDNPTEPTGEKRAAFNQFLHHQKRAAEEAGRAFDALIPPGFKEHGAEAGREFVKGFKVLVDAAIDGLEKASQELGKTAEQSQGGDRPSSTGPAKVKVQVD